jgi:Mannitol-1-phosphate/altronate dehydrogenases
MKAVHFGAGNIGRGFVGQLLHDAGYEVVFVDVDGALIDALAAADSYRVRSIGERPAEHVVTGFRAINSAADPARVISEIAAADLVTTAVGVRILPFVAPLVAQGLERRAAGADPLIVMACENAVGATDQLAAAVRAAAGGGRDLDGTAVFANTAVDRIVPEQAAGAGIDVTVEDFYEWVVDATPFDGTLPPIGGATFVDELAPYIERKLYTVNTGHATTAYCGYLECAPTIADAIALPSVHDSVARVLEETSRALVAKHGLDADEQARYRARILTRFRSEELHDAVTRVGREPLRKLGRRDRFIAPAAELAESGVVPVALLEAIGAVLRFDATGDPQARDLADQLRTLPAALAVERITGVTDEHPLFEPLRDVFVDARRSRWGLGLYRASGM